MFDWWLIENNILLVTVWPIWEYFGYTPLPIVDITTADMVKAAAKNPNTWIFYYSGHGGINADIGLNYLLPGGNPGNDAVYPYDIYTAGKPSDGKIVFLNSCKSFLPGGFDVAFGIDGWHNVYSLPRDEAFLGWTDSTWTLKSEALAIEFWLLMGSYTIVNGQKQFMTVEQAINTIRNIDKSLPVSVYQSEKFDTIIKGSPTLVP